MGAIALLAVAVLVASAEAQVPSVTPVATPTPITEAPPFFSLFEASPLDVAAPWAAGLTAIPPFAPLSAAAPATFELGEPRVERTRFPSGSDRVLADVFTPAGAGPHPVVALLHGAHPRRSEKYYMSLGEELARHGFLTLFVRVYERGRQGRGSRADWRRSISDALTFATSLPAADPDRMGVLGFSLGAFLALEQAPRDPRIRAAVAFYGGLSRGLVDLSLDAMPPVLLLHGTADRVVPARRSVEVAEKLRQAGREADLIVYPAARHGFCLNGRGGVDRGVAGDAWSRAVAFLDRRLLLPAAEPSLPAPTDPGASWLGPAEGAVAVLVNPSADEVRQVSAPAAGGKPAKRRSAAPAGDGPSPGPVQPVHP